MNPRLVLSLWRERWGKAADAARGLPYLRGKLTRWGGVLTHSEAWSLPGMTALALLGCVVAFIMLMTAQFSLGGQTAFAILFVGIALYVRRYAGTLVTLVLLGLFVIVSSRYLYWRITATLAPDFNPDFVLGLGLCAAELYLWLLMLLRVVQVVWPLTRVPVSLPPESDEWPTVDVFIAAQGQTDAVVRQVTLAALALDWPKAKLKACILDGSTRESLQEFADSIGSGYLVHSDSADGQSGPINSALSDTQGELILILDGAQSPDRTLLQSIVGWFVRDQTLGMLQTPRHFLAPMPTSVSLALCHASTLPGNVACAVLRRTMLTDVGGIPSGRVTAQAHTALQLQASGYGHGYIGCTETRAEQAGELSHEALGAGRDASSKTVLFRVDDPFLGQRLRWKQHLATLQTMLQFYYALPRLIFFTAPLAYLLAGAQVIQTAPALLGAYALPYLLLTCFTQARLRAATRLSTWADIRETALAWYLLIPTTLTLLRTELRRCWGAVQVDPLAPFDRLIVWPYGLVAFLSLVGLAVGIARLWGLQGDVLVAAILYLLWCACNLLLLAALLAVAEESRQVRQKTRLLLQMSAMVQLPSGHTIACVTLNFPQTDLSLKLPVPRAVQTASSIHLSIFRGHREFTFPARVTAQREDELFVHIEEAAQNDYQLFGAAVLSRGPDWPKWLPGRDADHPIPLWISRRIGAVWTKVLTVAWSFDTFVKWSRLGNWIGK